MGAGAFDLVLFARVAFLPSADPNELRYPRALPRKDGAQDAEPEGRGHPHQKPTPTSHDAAPITGPLGVLQRTIFNVLCIASYGHVGLDPVWASIRLEEEGDDSVWVEGTRQICDRLNNLLVVLMLVNPKGSLLLATSAAFITTVPPRPTTVDYTLRGPYICLLSAFGLLIGGIIVTAVSFLVLSKARPNWSERVLYSSRFHVYSTLIMLSYPIFSSEPQLPCSDPASSSDVGR
ncbi:hypothetical protein MVEN_02640100 [Mycena venus]|uniref:Uncharacterized protein n=1 Tax=Mycena venus TaxID=2733690 RepID=A0A8H6TYR3_9AGAR|nr:hypothetical protein MVEN_02640100 [Mycena venus]